MRLKISVMVAIITLPLYLCYCSDLSDPPSTNSSLISGNSVFAIALYQNLRSSEGNIFFSPYSLSAALALTYGGARGKTKEEMAQALRFSLDQANLHPAFQRLESRLNEIQNSGEVRLAIANSIWPERTYKLLDSYISLVKEHYGVSIRPVDYKFNYEKARKTINAWVENKTQGNIKDLIQPEILSNLTRLVLVNAIYFNGDWEHQFKEGLTKSAPFYISPSQSINVPLMAQARKLGYAKMDLGQILELPYTGRKLSMFIILPYKKDGLKEIEENLSVQNLAEWKKELKEEHVKIFLPRFEIKCGYRMNQTLKSMGMIDAFNMRRADFSGMDGNRDGLYISEVLHRAFVKVNEAGTEAAASTAVVMMGKSIRPPAPVFRADHPFIFMIQENQTGSILFMGRVQNP